MKHILLLIVKFYRKILSPMKSSPTCKYYPSCSAYAAAAIERFGAFKGSILTVWRVFRCNPWSLGGIDYVPEKFYLYTLKSRAKREGAILAQNGYHDEDES